MTGPAHETLRFSNFQIDLQTKELCRDGRPIKLPPQAFRLLEFLASHPGQLVTREEIQQEIWSGNTFVDFEHAINKSIRQIRNALRDDADQPKFIETVPRRGYRFIAALEPKDCAPRAARDISGIGLILEEQPQAERLRHGKLSWLITGLTVALVALGGIYWRETRIVDRPLQPLMRLSVDLGPDGRWSIPDYCNFTRWSAAGISHQGPGRQANARNAIARRDQAGVACGDRERERPVLFARWKMDRVFCRRKDEKDLRAGWCPRRVVRCAQRARRKLGR
jgi:DNA-binding winged helix-turn-helix (wHTH) protein